MYNNIGKKIKGLAQIIAYGGIFLSCLIGIALSLGFLADDNFSGSPLIGIAIAFAGSLICWLSGFFTYGFGELVDQTTEINQNLKTRKAEHKE